MTVDSPRTRLRGKAQKTKLLQVPEIGRWSLWADEDMEPESVTLVPSHVILNMEINATKQLPEHAVVAKVENESARFIVPRAIAPKEFVAPFWYLRVVDKKEDANFELVDKVVKCPACFIEGDARKAKPQPKVITIPVAVNKKRIAKLQGA